MTASLLIGRTVHQLRLGCVRAGLRPLKRIDIINQLMLAGGYRDYLEIGVRKGNNFRRVLSPNRIGVDPDPASVATRKMTSDDFFREIAGTDTRFDLVFVDGLHLEEQVNSDIANSLLHLRDHGAIVVHDCNPAEEAHQSEEYRGFGTWNGTVWKSIARLRMTRTDLEIRVVEADFGCGIIRRGHQDVFPTAQEGAVSYDFLEQNRVDLLNLISPAEFLSSPLPGSGQSPNR